MLLNGEGMQLLIIYFVIAIIYVHYWPISYKDGPNQQVSFY